MIKAIAAIDTNRGIADNHGLPWQGKIPGDVRYYHKHIQNGDLILMGFGLYKELKRPYSGSVNYVATNKPVELMDGFEAVTDARKFLEKANQDGKDVWNLGGALLFESTFDLLDELYITQLDQAFECTKFFPEFKDKFVLKSESEPVTENGITYTFQVWARK